MADSSSRPRHHTARGFRNNHTTDQHGGFDVLRWLPGFLLKPYRKPQFTVLRPPVERLRHNRTQDTLTWIGHSSFLLQLGGRNLVTDPVLSERASPLGFALQTMAGVRSAHAPQNVALAASVQTD